MLSVGRQKEDCISVMSVDRQDEDCVSVLSVGRQKEDSALVCCQWEGKRKTVSWRAVRYEVKRKIVSVRKALVYVL